MTTHNLIRARLETGRKALLEVLDHVPDDILGWAPREGMRTISGQLVEILGSERQLICALRNQPIPSDDDIRAWIGDLASLENLRAKLATVRDETLAYLETLSEADLAAPAGIPAHWHEALGLPDCPRSETLRSIESHEAYHTGQLITTLWARGDNPYKW